MGLGSTYRRCRFWQKKMIFSGEAYFDLFGYVNKQNCRIWVQKPRTHALNSRRTQNESRVWCEFWSRGIIGPICSENVQEEVVTVKGDHYRAMLN